MHFALSVTMDVFLQVVSDGEMSEVRDCPSISVTCSVENGASANSRYPSINI